MKYNVNCKFLRVKKINKIEFKQNKVNFGFGAVCS